MEIITLFYHQWQEGSAKADPDWASSAAKCHKSVKQTSARISVGCLREPEMCRQLLNIWFAVKWPEQNTSQNKSSPDSSPGCTIIAFLITSVMYNHVIYSTAYVTSSVTSVFMQSANLKLARGHWKRKSRCLNQSEKCRWFTSFHSRLLATRAPISQSALPFSKKHQYVGVKRLLGWVNWVFQMYLYAEGKTACH